MLALFRKGGSGSGWYGPPRGTHLPSSADIKTEEEARQWWGTNLGGKTLELSVHRKAGEFLVNVHFAKGNDHAFTAKSDRSNPVSARAFSPERARLMSRILGTIERPHSLLAAPGNADLFFERVDSHSHYCVALSWDSTKRAYLFKSAHVWTSDEIRQAVKRGQRPAPTRGKKKAPMLKAVGACPAVPVFGSVEPGAGDGDPSDAHAGGRSRQEGTLLLVSDLIKAGIPEGARWITIHPNGADSKGQPVLIQPQPDGSAHVIGGAGGKLNYLKLRGVRKESEYKKEASDRQKTRADQKKQQRKQDKEAGLAESKKVAREALKVQRLKHESEFVGKVADTMGWDRKDLEFREEDHAHLSDGAVSKLREKHHRELLKRATDAVELQRQRLITDPDARSEAKIDPDAIVTHDIDPVAPSSTGLGFAPQYKERAERQGLDEKELATESAEIKERKQADMTEGQRRAVTSRAATAKAIGAELQNLREPVIDAKASIVDTKKAVDLLKAHRQLRQVQKQAKDAAGEIDRAKSEPKAYVLEYSADPDLDAKVKEDLANDLRTVQTRSFLSKAHELAGQKGLDSLGNHIGIGAFNSINSLALAAGGDALVDRSVVDVLGIAGAAQVLARRLHTDLRPEEIQQVTDGVQDFHLHHYAETSAAALKQATDLMESAQSVEIGDAQSGHELQTAQALNDRRRGATRDAQKILGQALGEMEANAALVVALKQGKKDQFQVSLGKTGVESAVRQARALGLQRGDYEISHAGGDTFLSVKGVGLDRLAKPVSRADLAQVRRNLDIIGGGQDEDGWLPHGIANRPDLTMHVSPGVAPRMAEPFKPGEDLQQSLKDYIGGRAADGDAPADIVADIQSADFMRKVGDRSADYRKALDDVAPLKDGDGKMQRAEALSERFETYADEFAKKRGGDRAPIHRQSFEVNQKSVDALHRALADTPEGASAYKPIGELQNSDQRALREFFHRNIAKESPEGARLRADLEEHGKNEPERESVDMFGEKATKPEWTSWQQRRDDLTQRAGAETLNWAKYAESMHGHERAYEAVQDLIRSRISQSFVEHHNKLNPKSPLKLGKTVVRNNLNHLDATDRTARAARQEKERALIDGLRERSQGRYAAGGVAEKMDAARDRQEAFDQSQMGFFSADEHPADKPADLAGDERHTIGHQAERQIAGMMPHVGKNFRAGQPVKLWAPSMSGGKNAARQRLIKMLAANKRVVAAFGTGSGKSLLQLAGFTHLHGEGKAKRGLALVPSIVQMQFSGEALRYLEPGKYNWHIEPGASRDERIAAYKDPKNHFSVMTHSAFRDDMVHLGAKKADISEEEMSGRLGKMQPDERKQWMRELMDHEGIDFDYLTVDEGQNTLNRQGKENSSLANVVDALSAHTPYYMTASGDPVKNDASEVHDLLSKMDPDRYQDRAAFLRRYGADTIAAKDGLRREMARYVYPSKIDPDVGITRTTRNIALSDGQKKSLADLDRHMANARLARMQGKVDVDAAKAIAPEMFRDAPAEKHGEIAGHVQKSLGILKSSSINRIIHTHPDNPTVDDIAAQAKARKGKPGIVFAHSLESVKAISDRLAKEGHRVVTIDGADSPKEKERKRLMFNPERGEAKADILVASDAASTGMNTQRGQWLYQADTPQTALTHAQRNGRIFRTGQKNDVEVIDAVQDHPEVHRARQRLQRKYGLRELVTTPMEGLDDTGIAHFLKRRQVEQQQSSLL